MFKSKQPAIRQPSLFGIHTRGSDSLEALSSLHGGSLLKVTGVGLQKGFGTQRTETSERLGKYIGLKQLPV